MNAVHFNDAMHRYGFVSVSKHAEFMSRTGTFARQCHTFEPENPVLWHKWASTRFKSLE